MKGVWSILKFIVNFLQALGGVTIGILVLLGLLIAAMARSGAEPRPSVANGSVLVVWPTGVIVEQAEHPDPFEKVFSKYSSAPPQTSIYDITNALKRAKTDSRIAAVALITDSMFGAAPAHLHEMAAAIRDFKTSGKKVYAISSSYDQGDYMVAAEADKVFLNPAGSVLLTGFGQYPTYYKSLLDKIGANVNVFRVGTYKSAVEPFIRDDMSPEAKEANLAFLNALWDQYDASITAARGLEPGALKNSIDNMPTLLRDAGGNFAEYAKLTGLVDELAPRATWRQALMDEYGSDRDGISFKQIHFQTYLAATEHHKSSGNEIAVITAQGMIVNGEGGIDVTAGETTVGYIREARNDPHTAAIVLRIDSPGGSAYASELIRQELVAAQNQGIKVIASMGPVAASGGYWIAATSDEIWAEPSTITGSIGIFGVVATFENTLDKIGVHSDGVGTSPLAGAFNPARGLNDAAKDIIQQSIEAGYKQFLGLVSEGRNMTVEDADKIAQGRVWIGTKAQELGLVDHLGGFDDAVTAAANAAGIDDDYAVVFYRDQPETLEQIFEDMFNSMSSMIDGAAPAQPNWTPAMGLAYKVKQDAEFLLKFDDPLGQYSLCLSCEAR